MQGSVRDVRTEHSAGVAQVQVKCKNRRFFENRWVEIASSVVPDALARFLQIVDHSGICKKRAVLQVATANLS
jgi:hypothetical protein